MLTRLVIEGGYVSLICEELGFDHRRPLEVAGLAAIVSGYAVAREQGDVTVAEDRWAWITEPDGMWQKWTVMPTIAANERTRLVSLSFDDILDQRFSPTVDALMPPGANDEDT